LANVTAQTSSGR